MSNPSDKNFPGENDPTPAGSGPGLAARRTLANGRHPLPTARPPPRSPAVEDTETALMTSVATPAETRVTTGVVTGAAPAATPGPRPLAPAPAPAPSQRGIQPPVEAPPSTAGVASPRPQSQGVFTGVNNRQRPPSSGVFTGVNNRQRPTSQGVFTGVNRPHRTNAAASATADTQPRTIPGSRGNSSTSVNRQQRTNAAASATADTQPRTIPGSRGNSSTSLNPRQHTSATAPAVADTQPSTIPGSQGNSFTPVNPRQQTSAAIPATAATAADTRPSAIPTENGKVKCSICGRVLMKGSFARHCTSWHNAAAKKKHCPFQGCNFESARTDALKDHLQKRHYYYARNNAAVAALADEHEDGPGLPASTTAPPPSASATTASSERGSLQAMSQSHISRYPRAVLLDIIIEQRLRLNEVRERVMILVSAIKSYDPNYQPSFKLPNVGLVTAVGHKDFDDQLKPELVQLYRAEWKELEEHNWDAVIQGLEIELAEWEHPMFQDILGLATASEATILEATPAPEDEDDLQGPEDDDSLYEMDWRAE